MKVLHPPQQGQGEAKLNLYYNDFVGWLIYIRRRTVIIRVQKEREREIHIRAAQVPSKALSNIAGCRNKNIWHWSSTSSFTYFVYSFCFKFNAESKHKTASPQPNRKDRRNSREMLSQQSTHSTWYLPLAGRLPRELLGSWWIFLECPWRQLHFQWCHMQLSQEVVECGSRTCQRKQQWLSQRSTDWCNWSPSLQPQRSPQLRCLLICSWCWSHPHFHRL